MTRAQLQEVKEHIEYLYAAGLISRFNYHINLQSLANVKIKGE